MLFTEMINIKKKWSLYNDNDNDNDNILFDYNI